MAKATGGGARSGGAAARRATTGAAAGSLGENLLLNDETMGQLLNRVSDDRGVRKELGAILQARGRQVFQDWVNPGKISGRLYQRFRNQGMSHKDAKSHANRNIKSYTAKYNDVLKGT